MKTTLLFSILICLTLSACSSTSTKRELSTRVERELVLPRGASRYEIKDKQVFFMPTSIESPMPVYPEALIDRLEQDVVVCAEITISEDGVVSSVNEVDIDSECATPDIQGGQNLFPLVSDAVMRWTYFSAGVCNYQFSRSECDGADATIEPVAIKLAYKFRFRKEGVGFEQVRMTRN